MGARRMIPSSAHSEKKIKKDSKKALATLKRMGALDLVEILGLKKSKEVDDG